MSTPECSGCVLSFLIVVVLFSAELRDVNRLVVCHGRFQQNVRCLSVATYTFYSISFFSWKCFVYSVNVFYFQTYFFYVVKDTAFEKRRYSLVC